MEKDQGRTRKSKSSNQDPNSLKISRNPSSCSKKNLISKKKLQTRIETIPEESGEDSTIGEIHVRVVGNASTSASSASTSRSSNNSNTLGSDYVGQIQIHISEQSDSGEATEVSPKRSRNSLEASEIRLKRQSTFRTTSKESENSKAASSHASKIKSPCKSKRFEASQVSQKRAQPKSKLFEDLKNFHNQIQECIVAEFQELDKSAQALKSKSSAGQRRSKKRTDELQNMNDQYEYDIFGQRHKKKFPYYPYGIIKQQSCSKSSAASSRRGKHRK